MHILKTSLRGALGRCLDLPGENKTNIESDVYSTPVAGWEGAVAYSSLILIGLITARGERAEVPRQPERESDALRCFACEQTRARACTPLCALAAPRRAAARERLVVRPARWAVTARPRVSSLCRLGGAHPQGASACVSLALPPPDSFRSQGLGACSRVLRLLKTGVFRGQQEGAQQEGAQREDVDAAQRSGQGGRHGHARSRNAGACELARWHRCSLWAHVRV